MWVAFATALTSQGTYCGVFRRQALDRGASLLGIKHIVTGHNADDVAETVLMNRMSLADETLRLTLPVLRGDVARLPRSTEITSHSEHSAIKRSKPLIYAYEKEIVLYAHFKRLDYFSTECTYSPEAFRGTARALIKDLERRRPSSILDTVYSGEAMMLGEQARAGLKPMRSCSRCGYISSNELCKACLLLQGLNSSRARVQLEHDDTRRTEASASSQIAADF